MLLVRHSACKENILKPTFEGALALARSATGPLSPHLPAFVTSLIDQRYAVVCVRAKAWRAVAFDTWLVQKGVDLVDVGDAHIDKFHRRDYRPRSDCRAAPQLHESSALRQLLRYLRGQGLCTPVAIATSPAEVLTASFARFLLRDRGFAVVSIRGYTTPVRNFLVHRFGSLTIDLGAVTANDIISFVRHEAKRCKPRILKLVITALRAFLRFAVYQGEISASLLGAVPAVAAWATTPSIPKAISAEHAKSVIESCDLRTSVGQRDRAVLLLLARLGLRGCELVALMLDDLDWGASRLRVRGKNGHECLMPLPTDVGEAIALYLQSGRPASTDRHLFLRARAPARSLKHGSDGVGSIVRNALRRAAVDSPRKGSHQFRHALAVQMLEGGASLPEIGELLRHRSPISTSIYAKVDLVALRGLALPWPRSAS
jgi:integrase/recombinase XerD